MCPDETNHQTNGAIRNVVPFLNTQRIDYLFQNSALNINYNFVSYLIEIRRPVFPNLNYISLNPLCICSPQLISAITPHALTSLSMASYGHAERSRSMELGATFATWVKFFYYAFLFNREGRGDCI